MKFGSIVCFPDDYFEFFSNGFVNLVGVRYEEKFFLEVDLKIIDYFGRY